MFGNNRGDCVGKLPGNGGLDGNPVNVCACTPRQITAICAKMFIFFLGKNILNNKSFFFYQMSKWIYIPSDYNSH